MNKVVFACSVVLVLLRTDGITANRVKLGKDLSKVHGDIKREHTHSNRTHLSRWFDTKASMSIPSNDICDIICDPDGCTEYVCEDGVCCTPGSPLSLCCPYDHPVCDIGGCCTTENPKECGIYCCEETALCCPNGCCDFPELCCGIGCCEANEVCCTDHCCDAGDSCCGSGCCDSSHTCCTVGGQLQCCSKTDTIDCSSLTYSPCVSQFDARPCEVKDTKLLMINATCPNVAKTKILYRVLRPDENCYEGLKAKFPSGHESVLSFVNCGSKPDFSSQYISFTSSLEVAKYYAHGIENVKIAQVEVNDDLLASCDVIDLTNIGERKLYLGDAESGKFAAYNCAYLLTCMARLPCKEF